MNGCMASVCAGSSALAPVAPVTPAPSACPSKKTTVAAGRQNRSVSCRATNGGGDDRLLWLPRREVLGGLSGVAAGLVGYSGLASAEDTCLKGDQVTDKNVECTDPAGGKIPCPPTQPEKIIDFKPERVVKRIRQPIHLLSLENQEKYKEAVKLMKNLPADNPLSFVQQAAIHEAYCDGHYKFDPTNKDRPFDVHFSWIFGPWHRMYIYFYERALGQLIHDDTFALPFWNWDTPAGMVVPPIFRDDAASLYDANRNMNFMDKLVDLDYLASRNKPDGPVIIPFDEPQNPKYKELVYSNLAVLHQQQIRTGKGARAFLGEKFCTLASEKAQQEGLTPEELQSKKTKAQGTLERMAHTALHVWVGKNGDDNNNCAMGHDGKPKCQNDLGFLGSSGRDPLFYSHHANVDRLWHIWSTTLRGKGFPDREWLDTTFVFWDNVDNPQRVRVKFRDVLDATNLGYTYDKLAEKDLPWIKCDLKTLVPHGKGAAPRASTRTGPVKYPLTLKQGTPVEVPAVAVPAAEPGKQRVLIIEGIVYDPADQNKFDVAINVPKDKAGKVGPTCVEYAGSFSIVPSSKEGGGNLQGKVAFVIDDVLKDIGCVGDKDVDVVLVPRTTAEIKLGVAPVIENFDLD